MRFEVTNVAKRFGKEEPNGWLPVFIIGSFVFEFDFDFKSKLSFKVNHIPRNDLEHEVFMLRLDFLWFAFCITEDNET